MYLTQWNWIAMPDWLQLCLTIRYELVLLQLNLNSDHDCECS